MNYLKLMSILSEADADEYGVATQKKKKDEKDDFHRSKADQAFKDMHKVDVATEKDFETLGPITTKQHGDHKGNPSSINIGDATQQSPLKQFDMGGIGKSSYRKIDKTEGQKAMPKVDDGVTKVLRMKEEVEELDELSNDTLTRYKRHATNDEVNAVISGDKARASKRRRGKVAAGNAMYNNDQRAFTQKMKDKKIKEEAEIDEAVGTAAKYAHKKGVFGGKYRAQDHYLNVSNKTADKWQTKRLAQRRAEHEKQDPRLAKKGYTQNMVDAGKAEKKAKKRGVTNIPKLKGVNYVKIGQSHYADYLGENEEVEQLDELSPKTLNSYATKAQPDIRKQSLDAAKRKRRAKGVALARFKALRGSK